MTSKSKTSESKNSKPKTSTSNPLFEALASHGLRALPEHKDPVTKRKTRKKLESYDDSFVQMVDLMIADAKFKQSLLELKKSREQ